MISILPLTRRILYSVARKSNHVEDMSYWESRVAGEEAYTVLG
jgi:hypothetical protein